MAEQNGNGAGAPQVASKLSVLARYTRISPSIIPTRPRSLGPQQTPPNISIEINVNARQLVRSYYEANLALEGGAGQGAHTMSSS